MVHYYQAFVALQTGDQSAVTSALAQADACSPLHNYPLRLEEVNLFEALLQAQARQCPFALCLR